eukprot:CAMPEP_0172471210 /NCGR_PEP_ID=MMETSP1065-20121228/67700_1 /TAXON_ID=265537 /ORGANISM="Amphiprora paludosa, Strain CCMP125" /LENGTH=310 /DNA_ID=CAMNT_0013229305 /DNA_START=145 /DNA_END=1077 /DNA_ORIENTATION=-
MTTTTNPEAATTDPVEYLGSMETLMAEYDPILLFASRLLPSTTVRAQAGALYAWCRRLDEICDQVGADPVDTQRALKNWQERFDALTSGHPVDELDAALTACFASMPGLTVEPFEDMMAGMRDDAVPARRVANMAELEHYAYQVAGTVGLMLLPLLQAPIQQAREPAICLGQAIQLVNILRDASPDVDLGRIYLPQELLHAHNVDQAEILARQSSSGYETVVQIVAERAHELLQQAEVGKDCLPGFGPILVQVIVELYRGYLVELERRGYNNLQSPSSRNKCSEQEARVKISTMQKLKALLTAVQKVYFL